MDENEMTEGRANENKKTKMEEYSECTTLMVEATCHNVGKVG